MLAPMWSPGPSTSAKGPLQDLPDQPSSALLTSKDPWEGTWSPQNLLASSLLTCPHQGPQLRAVIGRWLLDHLSSAWAREVPWRGWA